MRLQTETLPSGARRIIVDAFDKIVSELVIDPDFQASVDEIRFGRVLTQTRHEPTEALIVRVRTNNRQLLTGQFVYFQPNAMRGFHDAIVTMALERALVDAGFVSDSRYFQVFLDIVEDEPGRGYAYRTLSLFEALERGLVDRGSALEEQMRKYNLETVLLAGSEISGPNIGMIAGVEDVCCKRQIRRCLDMFSGTGALAKVALANGVSEVVCVEKTEYGTQQEGTAIQLAAETDAWKFRFDEQFDLLILDPFYDLALRVAEDILPKAVGHCQQVVFNVGPVSDRGWARRVVEAVRRTVRDARIRPLGDSLVARGCLV